MLAIAVAVFAGAGSYVSVEAFVDGFAPAIGVAAALSLVGAIAGLWLPRRQRATDATERTRAIPALECEGGA